LESRSLLSTLATWDPLGNSTDFCGNHNWDVGNLSQTSWPDKGIAVFPAGATPTTVTVTSNIEADGIDFEQTGFVIAAASGAAISLPAEASPADFTVASAATATISSPIGGTGSPAKVGGGTLLVSGSLNVGSSSITVSAGQLQVQSGGSITAHGLTISDGATLVGSGTISIDGGGLHYDSSAASTFAGAITGAGGVVLDSGTTGSLTLSNTNNTYTGDTTVDAGSLIVSGRVGTGTAPTGDVVADNAATLEVDGSLTAQSVTIQDSAVLAGGRSGAERQHLQTAA
jgi:autotransporter-associated beta strand protein